MESFFPPNPVCLSTAKVVPVLKEKRDNFVDKTSGFYVVFIQKRFASLHFPAIAYIFLFKETTFF